MATEELEARIKKAKKDAVAAKKKARRDVAIHDHTVIRTYNYSRGTVLDHRSGKQASIKNVVEKGKIDLLK
jgi:protein subunit release factor A